MPQRTNKHKSGQLGRTSQIHYEVYSVHIKARTFVDTHRGLARVLQNPWDVKISSGRYRGPAARCPRPAH